MALKIDKDHWAFLDEIEAPMWVDLTVESKGQDLDDGWFHTSHLYHQCHSLDLKAAFAHSGEGSTSLGIDFNGPSSPKLPSSVSGSRGKHHRSKRQKEIDHVFPWNKQHPVNILAGKSSCNAGSGENIKPKATFINSKGTWRSKQSLVVERVLTGNGIKNNFKAISSHGDSEERLSCMENKSGDSNTSTITSENDRKILPKNLKVSSQAFGHSNGLLLALRTSLRKSCVTRQASRIYVTKRKDSSDSNAVSGKIYVTKRKDSSDSNAVSGNSSVGSSSKPGYTNKNSTFSLKQQKEQTADSRHGARTTRVTRSKVKDSTSSKVSNFQVKEGIHDSRTGRISNGSKPANRNAIKQKVQNQMFRAKALEPQRANEQHLPPCAVKAHDMERSSRLVIAGNENKPGRLPVNQKGNGGYITTGFMDRGQKGIKEVARWKGNRTTLAGPKEKACIPRSRGKHPTMTAQRIYLR